MGNDGSVTLKRKEILRESSKSGREADKFESKELNGLDLWTKCSLSGATLQEPIVSDFLGRLYNKEAVLLLLLDPESYSESVRKRAGHIKGLKDVAELRLDHSDDKRWICSMSGKDVLKEFRSGRFVYLATCGHVFSDSALTNIDTETCPKCDATIDKLSKVFINPNDMDLEVNKSRNTALNEKSLPHSMKKPKSKRKKEPSSDSARVKKAKIKVSV